MSLWVVVPALNEAENLTVLVPRIVEQVGRLDADGCVLVVDDGSTDDTTAAMAALMAVHPQVGVATMNHNVGKAAALQQGFGIALDGGADVVVMMDADGQDDPEELPRLLERLREGAGLVTGARLTRNDRFIKRNTSKVYNSVTGAMSGTPGRDFNSGFKMMTAEVAADVSPMLYGEMHRYLTVIAHGMGHEVAEVAVQHHARMSGSSKYGLARFWRGFADLVTVRFLLSYEHRPAHLFGAVGLGTFVLGTLMLVYLTIDKLVLGNPIGDRPLLIAGVLLALVGLQLVLFGLLAELIVHARNTASTARTHVTALPASRRTPAE